MMKAIEALVKAEVNKTVGNHTVQKCSNRTLMYPEVIGMVTTYGRKR